MTHELFSLLATLLTFAAFYPYIRSIYAGVTKPHVFSWMIWGLTTCIIFAAQRSDGAGVGAWPIGVSGLITFYIAWLAFQRKADITITRSDWLCFAVALASLPLWYLASDPLFTVILLTGMDGLALIPTLRKSYAYPHQEPLIFFVLMGLRNAAAIVALEHVSLTTILFPAVMGVGCVAILLMLLVRRWQLAPKADI